MAVRVSGSRSPVSFYVKGKRSRRERMPQESEGHRYKSTSGRQDSRARGERDRGKNNGETFGVVAVSLRYYLYANVSKSIYLYLFIAFKCFRAAHVGRRPPADHPRKRADPARCGLRDPWSPDRPLLSD